MFIVVLAAAMGGTVATGFPAIATCVGVRLNGLLLVTATVSLITSTDPGVAAAVLDSGREVTWSTATSTFFSFRVGSS